MLSELMEILNKTMKMSWNKLLQAKSLFSHFCESVFLRQDKMNSGITQHNIKLIMAQPDRPAASVAHFIPFNEKLQHLQYNVRHWILLNPWHVPWFAGISVNMETRRGLILLVLWNGTVAPPSRSPMYDMHVMKDGSGSNVQSAMSHSQSRNLWLCDRLVHRKNILILE